MERELPKLGSDWWAKGVLGNLTPQQAQIAKDNHWSDLPDLDLAALIQVVDRNWNLLADKGLGKRETRNWLKESLTVRHRWAHESPGRKVSHDQAFRDLDTLDRLARALLPESQEAEALSHARAEALRALISTAAPTEPEPTATSPAEELPLGSKPLADPTNDSDQVRELQVRAPRIFRTQAKADSPARLALGQWGD
ncbi:hypothetical protein G7085_11230 [Tessaracoccus sp. HDW20]|nr:Swt1 family HEPN domain-containing protein [Tessaracoccus coleopterorum]NHB84993.1 hypothetical protein [Tessaracoccus coleopterorum]